MYITEIFLQGFRNLSQLHIEPSEGINVIYGSNAQGKTNFLESLYFCAMGRSMRGKSDQQLIAFGWHPGKAISAFWYRRRIAGIKLMCI